MRRLRFYWPTDEWPILCVQCTHTITMKYSAKTLSLSLLLFLRNILVVVLVVVSAKTCVSIAVKIIIGSALKK